MGSLGALLLAVGYGADYSRRCKADPHAGLRHLHGRCIFRLSDCVCCFTACGYPTTASFHGRWLIVDGIVVGIVLLPGTTFKFGQLKESVFLTARTTAMVCWLFIGSFMFSAVFAYLGGHEPIEKFVLAMNLSPTGFMVLAQIIIFILGWPLEWTEIIVIFMPIFLPLLKPSTSIRCSSACWSRSTSRPRSCRRRWRWRRSISRGWRRNGSTSTTSSGA